MKKFNFSIIFLSACLFSCNHSNDNDIISVCEDSAKKDIIKDLKYPESYKKISTIILDTIMEVQDLEKTMNLFYSEKSIESNKEMVEKYRRLSESLLTCDVCIDKINDFNNQIEILEIKRDSMKKIIQTTDGKIVSYINIEHKYRATNNSGSLIIGKEVIRYYPNQIDQSKKIFIYSKD